MKVSEKMTPRSIRFPNELWDALCEEAKKQGVTAQEMIRKAVASYLLLATSEPPPNSDA